MNSSAFFLPRDTQTHHECRRSGHVAAILACLFASMTAAMDLHVSPTGSDVNRGTAARPLATLQEAQKAVRQSDDVGPKTVYLHEGVHYLSTPLILTMEDSGTAEAPVTFAAAPGEKRNSPCWKS